MWHRAVINMDRMQAATAVDRDLFRKACSRFATGIAIATVAGPEGTPYGLTVNSFTSVSCCPPLVLICVDYRCSILPAFRSSNWYGVNILRDTQRDLSLRFSQRELDRFGGLDWYRGQSGVPLLRSALASMECCVTQTVEAGDHAILVAEVTSAEWRDGDPLLYYASAYRELARNINDT